MLIYTLTLNCESRGEIGHYQLIQEIFILSNQLGTKNIKINVNKINSHIGIYGNQMADKLAKYAATIARMCKYGECKYIKYDMNKNPIQVDIAKDLIRLRKIRKRNRNMQMMNMYNYSKENGTKECNENSIENDVDGGGQNRYVGDGIFIKSIVDFDYKINNRTNEMKELEYLTQRECSIIMKLRTEFINLVLVLVCSRYYLCDMVTSTP